MIAPGWPGNLLALVAGAITTLALAPFELWQFTVAAVGFFYAGLRELTPRQALWRGWCFGFGIVSETVFETVLATVWATLRAALRGPIWAPGRPTAGGSRVRCGSAAGASA